MSTPTSPDVVRDPTAWFAIIAVAVAAVLAVVVLIAGIRGGDDAEAVTARSDGSGSITATDAAPIDLDDGAVADPDADPTVVIAQAAEAMAQVRSVEFELDRDGAPIFIDQFQSIALDDLIGQFTVPTRAQAQLTVTVDGDLTTRIGAVAINDEVWISNPVTGNFETLPDGYDIDPSRFFDPQGGWQPLLANLRDVELVGIEDRGGQRYHLRGTAPSAEVANITVGLVRDQDVPVDLWIHPTTSLVTHAEFDTLIDGAESSWALALDRYGDAFSIEPPENLRGGG
ncbi:MAG: LppX_LprAFG lipoprotein [Actinomycetota bacterium]